MSREDKMNNVYEWLELILLWVDSQTIGREEGF